MKTVYHKASSRGHANHGWLDSHHTFSFAGYQNTDRMHFGVLRVLNDDIVAGGEGFGMHPHNDMEIISIPLEGDLEHEDSMGNKATIRKGEVQVMTAGTGIMHSEKNASASQDVKFLQIWLFPREKGLEPRYDQVTIGTDVYQEIVSPNKDGEGVWIHQDAWFHLLKPEEDYTKTYTLNKEGNGVYLFVIEGGAKVGDQVLAKRDGLGISEVENLEIEALKDSTILIMEIPMELPR